MEYKNDYLQLAKNAKTLNDLATQIGTDQQTIVNWARTFDQNENLVYPEFFTVIYRLAANTKECHACYPEPNKTISVNENNECSACGRVVIPLYKQSEEAKKKDHELNAKQERFCQLYATDREFFGNGVESYLESYGADRSKPNWYKGAQASASRLLSNVIVYTRISELLEVSGFNDQNADKQLLFVINQHTDLSSKVAALREYNKLKKRIIERIDHTTNGKEFPAPIYGGKSTENI